MASQKRQRQAPLASAFVLAVLAIRCASAQPFSAAQSPKQDQNPAPQPGTESIPVPPTQQNHDPPGGKRVFGVLPNHRTADSSQQGVAISSRAKLKIAAKDSFDYPLVALGGVLAGLGQLANQSPEFGQGMKGYAHRLATNYADQALGNMFTEGFFPVLLHEDPRYFRRGTGTTWSRARYALTRVMITETDAGAKRFNYSEWLGNSSVVAISNLYYPGGRTVSANVTKLVEQFGMDAISQVLKEFWPDIPRKLRSKHSD